MNVVKTVFLTILLSCWVIVLPGCAEKESVTIPDTWSHLKNQEVDEDSVDLSVTDFNILFIGNSLTWVNNLPHLVREYGKTKNLDIGTTMIAISNYALIDHWNDGEAQKEIAKRLYDFVIIQQGPSSQAFGRELLIDYGKKFKTICDENEAELAYFMVWPSLSYYETFDGVIKNHEEAASLNNALLCPVGKIWKQHFDASGEFDYYGGDGFHPSALGSQVAAQIILSSLL